jgi:hypothetical protein
MTTQITNSDDIIDSRDIIERIEQLDGRQFDHNDLTKVELEELAALKALAAECEQYASDWQYGEPLIRRSYFETYIGELIDDCYSIPKDIDTNSWPYRHLSFDLDAAAEEAEQDYTEVNFGGVEYLIRSV